MALNCPRCGGAIQSQPEREWDFQNYHVSRYLCECGDKFNLYTGTKKTFTIPRPLSLKGFCPDCKTRNPAYAIYCKNCGTKLPTGVA
jgi:hypothetical protein